MTTIYDYIKNQISAYQKPIDLTEGWHWPMKDHLEHSFLLKNSQFIQHNENRTLRPKRNIILAMLNLQYRLEGFDIKDADIYVDDVDESYKSFLVKKFHGKWVLENFIDTAIDESVESYADYGGTLVRKSDTARPEVMDLRTIAFCNQTNILAYPFGINHVLSASELRDKTKWGDGNYGATMDVETLIKLAKREEKDEIEVFEVHGTLPVEWLSDSPSYVEETKKDVQQVQIVAYYKDENNQEQGVTLFKHKEPKLPFKFLARDEIKGRALGRGGVEELMEPQAWTDWNEIKVAEMLEAVSKNIIVTDDPTLAAKHPSGMKDMEQLELLEIQQGSSATILNNTARNLPAFNDAIVRWDELSQRINSSESLLGENPSSGTPFKLYEAQQIQGKGIHEYRKGKIATFWEEIYRDWIIPYIQKEIAQGSTFLSELSSDEMQSISEQVMENYANRKRTEEVLNGEMPTDKEFLRQEAQTQFMKGGNKKFIEILKDEIKKPISVMMNIAGKQKNLALLTDKLVNVMRQYISTPQIRQDPSMTKLLNTILESSGLSPIMFNPTPQPQQMQQPQQPQQGIQPMQALAQPQ